MRAGHIVQVGRGEDLYRAPAHPFVAEFLGRVNRIERSPESLARGVLTIGGVTLTCPAALNQPALLVRPEDIGIGPRQDGWGVARVEQRSFLGDRVQLRLSTAGVTGTLLADVARDVPYRHGDEVGIHIDPQRLMSTAEAST